MKIALIGFGEAGQMFGKGLAKKAYVHAYDIAITKAMQVKADKTGVLLSSDQGQVLSGADFVLSLVTADQALRAAKSAAKFLKPAQIYFEMNSVAPDTKRTISEIVPALVDVAVMAPVYPKEMKVPLLVSHSKDIHHAAILFGLGLNAKAAGKEIGRAAAIKMCRSVVIKGMEALTVECLSTARHYGVEVEVLASLHVSFPKMGWDKGRPDYLFKRVSVHGRRRAAEMREAARTVADAGVPSQMALETSKTQDLFAKNIQPDQ